MRSSTAFQPGLADTLTVSGLGTTEVASHLKEHLAWEMEPVLLSGARHSAT